MYLDIKAAPVIQATLNFSADRADGGIWSNTDRSLITQALSGHVVDLRDARAIQGGPSIEAEGFCVRNAPMDGAAWTDAAWVSAVYIPHCLEMVRELSGAAYVTPMQDSVLIRDTGDVKRAPAAEFVHLDNSRDAIPTMLDRMMIDPEMRARLPRVKVFNVWRALTPAPQDVPLGLCDQRTLDPQDWVVGRTIEPAIVPEGVPYVTSTPNPGQRWWWVSDMSVDEAIVFKGYDSNPAAPFGCLHGASAETRIFAFFEG
jgi:hypothetical protein